MNPRSLGHAGDPGCHPERSKLEETAMRTMIKPAVVLGLAGVLALGSMTTSEARGARPWVAAGIGLAAGAAIAGAAAASSGYYGPYGYGYGYPAYDAYA